MTFLCVDFIVTFDSTLEVSTQLSIDDTVKWFYCPLQILNRINFSSPMPGTHYFFAPHMHIDTIEWNGIDLYCMLIQQSSTADRMDWTVKWKTVVYWNWNTIDVHFYRLIFKRFVSAGGLLF